MAVYYRTQGPQRKKYSWELEGYEDESDDEGAYWRSNHT
jgi:hypothetical protein